MDEVRTGAPVGQTPPTPPAPPPGPTPIAAQGPPLQLPAPQGGAIAVVTDRMAWRLAKLHALATQREFARLGMRVEWNAQRPDILERARAAADEMYGSIIQTAGQRVKDYFTAQLAEGKAPPDIAKALSEQFQGVSGRQARMVARTVTRQLYNSAALDAYEAAGVREVTASDGHGGLTGKTDKACLARNGKTFTIAEAREQEHSPVTHPNCTLSWRPVVPDEGLRSEDSVMKAELPANGHRHLLLAWDPEKHPRWPEGTPEVGGEWMSTRSVIELVASGAPGLRDLGFLARGAQRIRSVHGAARGDGVDLHVEMRDGSSHLLHIPRTARWPVAMHALAALDAATPATGSSAHPMNRSARSLRSLEPGARFRIGDAPYERLTRGESKRGDGRLTVRNTETGKRIHMAPDRVVEPADPQPGGSARISVLEPGDRFQVGERVYELLGQGGAKRKDGRVTGRELATGKRVHFKPDRQVARTTGERRPPAPPPPPPEVKPPRRTPRPKPPVEVPAEYAALPREGESMESYIERWNREGLKLPPGYVFIHVPTGELEKPATAPIKPPQERYGTGRLYGVTSPTLPADGGSLVLAERQRGVEARYSRQFSHSYASVSRKNVVAAWTDAGDDTAPQVAYRTPKPPVEAGPAKLVVGKRVRLADVPGGDAHFIRMDGRRYQVDQHLANGETSLWPLLENGEPARNVPLRVDSERTVTYGLPEQKPIPEDIIRSRSETPASLVVRGEVVQLEGLYYRVTGFRRKGSLAGVEMKLMGDRSAPVTRVPFNASVTTIRLTPRPGEMTGGLNLMDGDEFRTQYGVWRVDQVERAPGKVIVHSTLVHAADGEPGRTWGMTASGQSVQFGRDEPTARGGRFLWEYKPGDLISYNGKGYEVVGQDAGTSRWVLDDVETGRQVTMYPYQPDYLPGLPPGLEPLPPRVDVPGHRLRDFAKGERVVYRGQEYVVKSAAGDSYAAHIRGNVQVQPVNDPAAGWMSLPDSSLVTKPGEDDPYGAGVERRERLIAKARELYQSRRAAITERDYRDIGALIHEAIGTLRPPNLDQRTVAESPGEYQERIARERRHSAHSLRAALSEIRPFAMPTSATIRGAGASEILDHDNRPAPVHDPDADDFAAFYEAQRWFPASWMDEVEADGGTRVAVGVYRGFYRHHAPFLGDPALKRMVAVSQDEKAATVQHEMGHRVEYAVQAIRAACAEFWQRRTAGESNVTLYEGRDEVAKEDHFQMRYAGKVYNGRGGGEVFSMGIEDLVHPYNRYADNRRRPTGASGQYSLLESDPDYAHFMLGLLAALKTDAEVAQIREEERRLSGA